MCFQFISLQCVRKSGLKIARLTGTEVLPYSVAKAIMRQVGSSDKKQDQQNFGAWRQGWKPIHGYIVRQISVAGAIVAIPKVICKSHSDAETPDRAGQISV